MGDPQPICSHDRPPTLSPSHEPSRVIVLGDPGVALRIARDDPRATVLLFARDWPAVDRAREAAHAAGLTDRLSVRHQSAAAALGLQLGVGSHVSGVPHRTPRLWAGGSGSTPTPRH